MDNQTGHLPLGDSCEAASHAVAELIRKKSESVELMSQSELARSLVDCCLLPIEGDERERCLEGAIEKALDENPDLVKLHTEGRENRYFSSQHMSESFARILLGKASDPLLLIVEIVRENSALYPRPVPVGMFANSPFDLSLEEIQICLARMHGQSDYKDICQTTTSIGNVFLYSTLHLEPGYAAILAEWLDVGQANNP